jgi:hypothetical protein
MAMGSFPLLQIKIRESLTVLDIYVPIPYNVAIYHPSRAANEKASHIYTSGGIK